MPSIQELVAEIGKKPVDGSSVSPGVPYQNIPGLDVPCSRANSERRAERIMELVDVTNKTVFDLGCSVGTISDVMGKKAFRVLGVDHDEHSINLAKSLYNSNVFFERSDLTLEFLENRIERIDVCIWTSQFMWMVKQHGMDYALDFLWKLSTKCDVLVFESAGRDDGMAPLDMGQDAFFELLTRNSVFQDIRDYGPWNDGWTPRNVFVCRNPFRGHEREWSSVTFPERGKVIKEFKNHPFAKELMDRELQFLKRLEGYFYFPKVISVSNNSLTLSYEGFPAYWIPEKDLQEILSILHSNGITHRDIQPSNILWNGNNIVLIDFSFATYRNEITNYHYDLGGSYKCRQGFSDEYSLRKIQAELISRNN